MELKKLTPDELIECAFVDALPQDREAIEAELRRRMTPTGDVAELLDLFCIAVDPFTRQGLEDKLCTAVAALQSSSEVCGVRINDLNSKLVASHARECGWRELVRELCAVWYGVTRCHFCGSDATTDDEYCTNHECPTFRARKLEEKS